MTTLWDPPKSTCAYLASEVGELSCVEVKEILAQGKSKFQDYAVLDTVPFGRILVLDGVIQSADFDEWMYHESFVIPALCSVKKPRKVLVLGGGEGSMLREVLRHPSVEKAIMVDIDEEVVGVCKEHLPQQHAGAFDDPRSTVIYDDARAWLEAQTDLNYDVILVDLTEPLDEGPSFKLFTKEFYELIKNSLAPGGVMALQAGSIRLGFSWAYAKVIHTLDHVFDHTIPYATWITSFAEQWGFCVAGGPELAKLTPEHIDLTLKDRNIDPKYLDGTAFIGLTHLPLYVRKEIAETTEIATDAKPLSFKR